MQASDRCTKASRISDLAELEPKLVSARVAMAVVYANKLNGFRKVATTSPSSQEQFHSTKLTSRSFSRGCCYSNSFRAFRASSRVWTPSCRIARRLVSLNLARAAILLFAPLG